MVSAYTAQDAKITEDLVRRARDAGVNTLVMTVDVPVSSKRERNMRNGFGLSVTFKLSTIAEVLTDRSLGTPTICVMASPCSRIGPRMRLRVPIRPALPVSCPLKCPRR